MRPLRSPLALGMVLCALSARAAADGDDLPCADRRALPAGPVQASLLDGELGRVQRACPRTELALAGAGVAVIRPDDFYGRLQAAGLMRGSWAPTEDAELHLRLELVRFDTVISSVEARALGVGHASLGGSHRVTERGRLRLAVGGRLVLPTALALYRHARPVALDVQALAEYRAYTALRLHGGVGPLASLALGHGPAQPRAGVSASAGLEWLPFRWGAVVIDVHGQLGYTAPLDVLAVGPALRFGGTRLGAELSALLPLLGEERALLGALAQLSGRL